MTPFWKGAKICNLAHGPQHTALYVSRLEPVEFKGDIIETLDDIERIQLPTDKASVETRIRQKHGGGVYSCMIRNEEDSRVLKRTWDADNIRVDGDPRIRHKANYDDEVEAAEKRLKLLDSEQREAKIRAQIDRTRREFSEGTEKKDDAALRAVAELRAEQAAEKREAILREQLLELRQEIKKIQEAPPRQTGQIGRGDRA